MRLSHEDMSRLSRTLARVVHSPYFDEDYDYAFEGFETEEEAQRSYQDYEGALELLKEYRISIHE